MTVVEADAPTQVNDVGSGIWRLDPLGQPRVRAQVAARIQQRVVDQLSDARGTFIVGLERMEAVRPDARSDDDDVGIDGGLTLKAGHLKDEGDNSQ